MKLKVLSIGRQLEHECIEQAPFGAAPVLTDYDAVIMDPDAVRATWFEVQPREDNSLFTNMTMYGGLGRRIDAVIEQKLGESSDFLGKGGVIVCYLRPVGEVLILRKSIGRNEVDFHHSIYAWLPDLGGQMGSIVRPGRGSNVLMHDTKHHFSQFIRAFSGRPEFGFQAYVNQSPTFAPIAVNGGGHPVCFEMSLRGGRVVFLPAFDTDDKRKEAGVLVQCVRGMLVNAEASEPPTWVAGYTVPGQGQHANEIAALEEEIANLQDRKGRLEGQEQELAQLRCLLYEQGKFQLEPVVRRALRILGFEVLEPDDYPEEWDVLLRSAEGDGVAEVEGRDDSAVDRDKFRHLLDYKVEWVGRKLQYKGLLIVNGYRLTYPRERQEQVTDFALRGCEDQGFCVLPTTDLFKAVCTVLARPEDADLKRAIRVSILSKVGLYEFEQAIGSAEGLISMNGVKT